MQSSTYVNGTSAAQSGWTWERALSGVVPPMISPLTEDGAVDVPAVGRVVEHILAGGCSGIFVVGGCGEGSWLSTVQRGAMIRATVEAAAGRAPVLAGLMLPATAPALDAAEQAVDAGADALVVGSPYYFSAGAAGQLRHVQAVLAATNLPVLLYDIPQCTHSVLAVDAVQTLAEEPRVLGIKDSSGDLGYFQQLLAIKTRRPDFRVLQGNELVMAASLLLGCDGLIPGYSNIAPRVYVAMRQAAAAGDVGACRAAQTTLADLNEIGLQAGIPAIKAACALLGLCQATPAAPFAPPSDAERQAIEGVLRRHHLLQAPVAA